ncbi:hypothetical protein [Aquisalinus flavus]|uniref:Mercuric transport protein MerT n=1 Tax=Aquisalinus flavus TaxID=1526572 RepID=A0A8J2Y5K8_9PROT|nr:hypothetical protein [Aquisalinus flavus]MBD0425637.1 hypothetical protein [Aquisalinus flavus]UNE48746.1 hypothetical protein FF099_12140 [Aquisalinus flavus]GGD14443.1 hypothetical protein GCM10011342_24050 [Aquisalinus flavus]
MRLWLRETAGPALALFASTGTLLCCALPALLITLGAGAVMAGLAANVPGLIWLTAHKGQLFAVSGLLLALAAFMKWRARNAPCPIDPAQARACMRMRRAGTVILAIAVVTYLTGGFFAFLAADLLL